MRLQSQLILPLVGAFLLFGAGAVASTIYAAQQYALEQGEAEMSIATSRLARRANALVDERVDSVVLLAEEKATTDYQMSLVEDGRVRYLLLEGNVLDVMRERTASQFRALSVTDAAGREVHRYERGSPTLDPAALRDRSSEEAFLLFARNPRAPAVVYVDRDGHEPTLVFAKGVADARGTFLGTVWGEAPLHGLLAEARETGIFSTGWAGIYDAGGARLDAPSDVEDHRAVIAEASGAEPVAYLDREEDALHVVQLALTTRPPSGEGESWYVVAEAPRREVIGIVQSTGVVLAAGLVLVLGAVVAVVVWTVRHTLAPLSELSAAVAAIGAGKLETCIEPRGGDELSTLAAGVNEMAAALQARERELAAQAEAQARMDKFATLGTLSAGVAHEVNNPLSIMLGNLQMLDEDLRDLAANAEAPASVRAWAEEARAASTMNLEAAGRIKKIVTSLRLLAKPEQAREPIALAPVVDATLALASSRLKARAHVECEVPGDLRAVASPDGMGQVLLNLLLNAADAVPAGSGVVRVRGERVGDRVRLVVEDNGPGVPAQVRASMFTPFMTTKKNGTGLGLSISHRIVAEHGGSLAYEEPTGGGARFVIDLPAAP